MHGRSELRACMKNELDILNALNHRKLIRLQDSFEIRDQMVLVLELYPFIFLFPKIMKIFSSFTLTIFHCLVTAGVVHT